MTLACPHCGTELRVAGGRRPNPDAVNPEEPKRYDCHACGKAVVVHPEPRKDGAP